MFVINVNIKYLDKKCSEMYISPGIKFMYPDSEIFIVDSLLDDAHDCHDFGIILIFTLGLFLPESLLKCCS